MTTTLPEYARRMGEANAALRAEVERLTDLLHTVANDAAARDARAEAAEAEVERLTDLLHTVTNDATARDARREVAEQQLADLRARIESVQKAIENNRGIDRAWDALNALLSGSSEQPGPLKAGVMALTGLSSDEVDALGGVREADSRLRNENLTGREWYYAQWLDEQAEQIARGGGRDDR